MFMNTTETFPTIEAPENSTPRRDFLVQAASMLGLAVSAGTVITLVNACETTVTKPANTGSTSTGGTSGSGTSTGGTMTSGNVIAIAQEQNLQSVGGAVIKTIGSDQLVIIRTSASEFLVLSAVCTHSGCTVDLPSGGRINCQCHGSSFSATDGRVLVGPAASPLRRYTAAFDPMKNELTITV